MTEETANTPVQGGQKPEWQAKADEMEKQVGNGLWTQMVYMSNSEHNCTPVLLSEKHTANIFPFVIDAPVGFVDPVFDWGKNVWTENDANSQAQRIASLTADVKSLQDYQKEATKQKAVSDQKDDQVFKLIASMNVQLGVINSKLDQATEKSQKDDTEKSTAPMTTPTQTAETQNQQNDATNEGGNK